MIQNIDKVTQRGDKLEDLGERAGEGRGGGRDKEEREGEKKGKGREDSEQGKKRERARRGGGVARSELRREVSAGRNHWPEVTASKGRSRKGS